MTGAEAVLAGSCSGATLEQIAVHTQRHPSRPVGADDVMSGRVDVASLLAFIRDNEGKAPLVYSSGGPDEVKIAQDKYGRHQVASAIENLFSDLAKAVVDSGIRRLVVAGGETSGAVVSALGLEALTIGPEIDPGVPVLYAQSGAPLALALKSGNFGAPDFFTKALAAMEGRA